ncbi:hypothetical protein [Virgibacillus salexigens]|uniref:hypothetical protein n=1 Tax=Virgibacillus salexigens TaxID=61016 RepID=UPI00308141C9
MEEKQLVSYAIMNVNQSKDMDSFDHFVPFVKEALLRSKEEIISSNVLKNDIVKYFKVELPISVVNTILKRKLLPKQYIYKKNHILKPNYQKLGDSNFKDIKAKMMEKHEKLIQDIIDYSKNKYGEELDTVETERAIESFLDQHQLLLLRSSLNESVPDLNSVEKKKGQIEFIISKFIKYAYESNLVSFDYLIDILKGTMLTNALYYKEDFSTFNMKYKGTEVYFDSTFLIYALGHAGEAKKEPCIELINILRENNAILKVFRHNIDEMIGILEFCKNNLTKKISDPHGTINNFLDKGYSQTDIDRLIYRIEEDLKEKFHIRVVESVKYDKFEYVISHGDLEERLKKNISYRNQTARERDVKSVSAIMRLRGSIEPIHIEKSRAIFVTNNFKLAQNVKDHFFDQDQPKKVPPVLHDSILTNIMWLKSPAKSPELPRKRLIAETYAATQPPERIWNKYVEMVNLFERSNTISQENTSSPFLLV